MTSVEDNTAEISFPENAPQVDWLIGYLGSVDDSDPLVRFVIAGILVGASILLLAISRTYLGYRLRKLETMESKPSAFRFQHQEILSADDVMRYIEAFIRMLRFGLTLMFGFGLLTGGMMISRLTESIAVALLNILFTSFNFIWTGFVGYLPDLFTIVVILIAVRFCLRFMRVIFDGVAAKRIRLPNFYPEWADTSFNLLKMMICGLTIVVIFPYLPGSDSPAFQGVSIFVGVLLSLGSTSAVANMVAGIVLTYTRAFQVGDQVKISDTRGNVVERTLFVTRLQTLKNVVVSIPNSMVLNDHIINYSKNMGRTGLLVHTNVTIGYDIAWQKVHELLLVAAEATKGLEKSPPAFVLQTSLDDFYVSYELNAWTKKSDELSNIYSALNANILDAFHEAKVEILSPHYRASRDGSSVAFPQQLSTEQGGD